MKNMLISFSRVNNFFPARSKPLYGLTFLLTLFFSISVIAQSPTISVPTTSPGLPLSICAGTGFNVNFSTSGTFNPGNQFQVQLSTVSGSFGIGTTIIGTGASSSIAVTIPITVSNSAGYRIRVVSTNPSVLGTGTASGNITILSKPTAPSASGGSRCGTGTVN